MNRDDTKALLTLRLAKTGDTFGAAMLDQWADDLRDIDHGEAVVAMRRACDKHAHVQWFQFHEELTAHQHGKAATHAPDPYADCPDCAGSGWREGPPIHEHGVLYATSERCHHERHAGRILDIEDGMAVMQVAYETEKARLAQVRTGRAS